MGSAPSITERILFPAPPSSYSASMPSLVWSRDCRNGEDRPFMLIPSGGNAGPLTGPAVIYLHGNACDLGHVQFELQELARKIRGTVLGVEYPGYGVLNNGVDSPTAKGIQEAAEHAFEYLTKERSIPPSSIFIFGRSIGSGVAASLAYSLASVGTFIGGLVLQSPYLSIHDVVEDYFPPGKLIVSNEWEPSKCLSSTELASTPLLVIHGKCDEVINVRHGEELYALATTAKKRIVLPPRATHNQFDVYDDVIGPTAEFIGTYHKTASGGGG
ncbi:hypothetical protein FOZ62_025618 [Perkinsus olseni]|uniref:Uncharacterized protein n=1 Tax=Perkinsus olseni TaxID=32597 RepID=A0A7J6TTS9_PEROL|nr:hypothetical protein FOZ62_025618 [Perkinsus olseni]